MENKSTLLIRAVLLFSLFMPAVNASVNVRSTVITSNDGLGNSVVRQIFQDSQGFMWMGTVNGLTRYDGHSFVTFRAGAGDGISLAGNHITRLTEDENQMLWVKVSPDYFSCYDLKNGCFVDFTGCGEYNEKYFNRLEASDGGCWLWHHQNGARKIFFENGVFSSAVFKKKNGKLPSESVKKVIEGTGGVVWICTNDGLARVVGKESRIVKTGLNILDAALHKDTLYFVTSGAEIYKTAPDGGEIAFVGMIDEEKTALNVTSSFYLHDGWVILTSDKGYVFRFDEQQVVPDPTMDVPNGQFIKDNRDNLWIYDDKGLIRNVNTTTGAVKDIHAAADNKITELWCSIIQDSRGLFWISTYGDGLFVYNPKTDETTHFTYQIDGVNHICSNTLTSVTEDRSGGIWVTSEPSGVSHIEVINDGASYIFPEDKSQVGIINTVRSISRMSNGEVWLSNRNREVYVYDRKLRRKLRTMQFHSSVMSI